MRRYALRDDKWDRIEEMLRAAKPCWRHGGGQLAVRRSRSVQISRRRPFARDLPARFGDWKSCLSALLLNRWAKSGVFERVLGSWPAITPTTST